MKLNHIKPLHLLGLVCLICVGILIYYGKQKIGYHIDEIYSYGLANSYSHPFPNDINQWLSGQYYQDYISTEWGHRFNFGAVYNNQVQDVHPPIYYILLHTIASIFPGVFNKWIGLSLNLITHLASLIVMIQIGKQISKNKYLPYLIGICWAVSLGGLNTFLFIRMYSLVTLWGLCLLWLSLLILEANELLLRKLLTLFMIILLGSLTHYYFIIYAFLLWPSYLVS